MTDEAIDLALRHIQAIRSDLAAIRGMQREHGESLERIEVGISRIGRDRAHDAETIRRMEARMDAMENRIARIGARLDPPDA